MTNGTFSLSGPQEVGENANVTCDDGFRIVGPSNNDITTNTLTCEENGDWNGTVKCELKGKRFV